MHHGTCVTHVMWCMSGLLNRGGGENVTGIPGASVTRNFTYLARGPWWFLRSRQPFWMTSSEQWKAYEIIDSQRNSEEYISNVIPIAVPADVLASLDTRGPFYQHGLTLIPAWISNQILGKVWDEITSIRSQTLTVDKSFHPTLHWACDNLSMHYKPVDVEYYQAERG